MLLILTRQYLHDKVRRQINQQEGTVSRYIWVALHGYGHISLTGCPLQRKVHIVRGARGRVYLLSQLTCAFATLS